MIIMNNYYHRSDVANDHHFIKVSGAYALEGPSYWSFIYPWEIAVNILLAKLHNYFEVCIMRGRGGGRGQPPPKGFKKGKN